LNFLSLLKRKIIFNFKKKINIDQDSFISNDLDQLFFHYGSDKSNKFKHTNKSGHGYSKFYKKYLKKKKNKRLNILEIGSYSGASAAAFKKYFSKSKIYCFDINISNFKYYSKDIKVFGLDIKNKISIEKILKKLTKRKKFEYFDLIIDDGSHNLSDILFAFKYLFKYLKKGGFYIIEDYMLPNKYKYNRDVKDILVDDMLKHLIKKKTFNSNIISEIDQIFFRKKIEKIYIEKGRLKESNICFIKKI
jgi:predicted O-methyltransferase YrrM